jgi:hypothetical protein
MSKRKSHSILEKHEANKLVSGLQAPSDPMLLASDFSERESASKDLPTIDEKKRRKAKKK